MDARVVQWRGVCLRSLFAQFVQWHAVGSMEVRRQFMNNNSINTACRHCQCQVCLWMIPPSFFCQCDFALLDPVLFSFNVASLHHTLLDGTFRRGRRVDWRTSFPAILVSDVRSNFQRSALRRDGVWGCTRVRWTLGCVV
jgi:hypothetical protein